MGTELLDANIEDISSPEAKLLQQHILECKLRLETSIDKLSNQSEKLAQALGDSDDELTETIIEEDSTLSEKARSVFYRLHFLEREINEMDKSTLKNVGESITDKTDESAMQKMCEFQMKLQQEFFTKQQERSEQQTKMHKELIVTQKVKSVSIPTAVKLPKLDIITFGGNRLQWIEFWDSFESAVHHNKGLSLVDKFNYLKGKLIGEPRRSISGLSLSNENYMVAVGILLERFGDKQEIIDLHHKGLTNLIPARDTTES